MANIKRYGVLIMVLYLRENLDLDSCGKSKEEIVKWVDRYKVKISNKLSPMGQEYQVVEGEYANVVSFLSAITDMGIVEVMCNVGNDMWWAKPGVERLVKRDEN